MTTTNPAGTPLRGIRHAPLGVGAFVALSLAAAAGGLLAVLPTLAHEPPQLSPSAESDLLPHGIAGDHRGVFITQPLHGRVAVLDWTSVIEVRELP
jgi:hypothetical protein